VAKAASVPTRLVACVRLPEAARSLSAS
jgi:hypothetical protein